MTATERRALYAAGLSPVDVNRLLRWRQRLYRHGHDGNVLLTPDLLRARRGAW